MEMWELAIIHADLLAPCKSMRRRMGCLKVLYIFDLVTEGRGPEAKLHPMWFSL